MIVDPDFFDHWKTQMLCNALGDQNASMYVLRLWAFCHTRKSDTFEHMPPDGLKAVCRWHGDASKLESELCNARFIYREGTTIIVHGWKEKNKALFKNWVNGAKGGRPKGEKNNPEETQTEFGLTQKEPSRNPVETQNGVGFAREEKKGEEKMGQDKTRQDNTADAVLVVFDHYRRLHPRAFKEPQKSSREWKAIEARLKEGFTSMDLCDAIDGCHRCPHNLGENDRGMKYLGLELIMRNASQVTRFIEQPANGSAVLSARTQASIRAGESFLARQAEKRNQSDLTQEGLFSDE